MSWPLKDDHSRTASGPEAERRNRFAAAAIEAAAGLVLIALSLVVSATAGIWPVSAVLGAFGVYALFHAALTAAGWIPAYEDAQRRDPARRR